MQCPAGHVNEPTATACVHCGMWLGGPEHTVKAPNWQPPDTGAPRVDETTPPPRPTATAPSRQRNRGRVRGLVGYGALFLVLALMAGTATLWFLRAGPFAPAAPAPTGPGQPAPAPIGQRDLKPKAVTASAGTPPAVDGCGAAVRYDAANLTDGDVGTAWRVAGDGTGTTIEFDFGADVVVTTVGLIPGYTKRDACSNDDRFGQMRRVAKVTWTFDDGTTVAQPFQDSATRQLLATNRIKSTRKVKLRIDGTTKPGDPTLDFTAISEIYFRGGGGL